MAYLMRDGVAIYYEVHGEGEPVLLTHGYAASAGMGRGQLPMLLQRHKVILWDMRGHGRTDSPADRTLYSEELTVGDMAAILDAAGVDRAVVGGHSLGGFMSLAFHLRHPDRVRALLLCGTGPGFRKDEPREAWNVYARRIGELISQNGIQTITQFTSEMEPADHKSAEGLLHAAYGMLTQHSADVLESLATIEVPTLITCGSKDQAFLGGSEYMGRKIPGAETHILSGADHAANIDSPDEYNDLLCAFLDRHRV